MQLHIVCYQYHCFVSDGATSPNVTVTTTTHHPAPSPIVVPPYPINPQHPTPVPQPVPPAPGFTPPAAGHHPPGPYLPPTGNFYVPTNTRFYKNLFPVLFIIIGSSGCTRVPLLVFHHLKSYNEFYVKLKLCAYSLRY